jgi:predicted membrane-bound spermidine synthase
VKESDSYQVDPSVALPLGSPNLSSRKTKRRPARHEAPAAKVAPPAPARVPAHPTVARLALLVFFSGCSALIFQVAWMRELRLLFGATTASVAAVLAVFMAGLGLGSAMLGKRIDRATNPLRVYGLLETGIALSVAVTPWLISFAGGLYIGLGGQQSLGIVGATAVRLALATVVMAVPSFLMGGTLPAAARAVTSAGDKHRGSLGVLYGSNTLGAVFGAGITTLFALEYFGTRATLWLGCALGLVVGTLAVGMARRLQPLADQAETTHDNFPGVQSDRRAEMDALAPTQPRPWLIYTTAAILGFSFFALELVWYRMLAPILGGTAFTFGLILSIALLGIGLGGITYNFVFRRLQPTWSALAITCGAEALFTLVPYALGDRLAIWAGRLNYAAETFTSLASGWGIIISIAVLPVALISGVQFPLLIALLGRGRQTVSEHIGRAYAWNTLGAIAGSLIAGFGAMPLLSAPGLWLAIAGLLAALSVGILITTSSFSQPSAIAVAALALITVSFMFAEGPTAAWRHGGIGAGRALIDFSEPNVLQNWLNAKRDSLVYEADGVESTVGISAQDGYAFVVNGKSDGAALGDAGTQIGAVALGATLNPAIKTGLVIGLGTGESAGWLAEFEGVQRVDVVELEPAIDEMARRCSDLNWDVLNHPRVHHIWADGREFVFTTRNTYDVIFSEPSNPYRAGVAALYTKEFYAAARERLNPGGIFIQWLQGYEISDATVLTVLATARTAFTHVEVWQSLSSDLQLVCSNGPLTYSVDSIRQRISSGRLKEALAKCWNVESVEDFLARFMASPAWADNAAVVPIVLLNTDDRTILEYAFAKTVGRQTPFSIEAIRQHVRESGWDRPKIAGSESIDWDQVEIRRQVFNLQARDQLSTALLTKPVDQELVNALNDCRNGLYAQALERWPAEHRNPTNGVVRLLLARVYAQLGRSECLDLTKATDAAYPIDSVALRAIYYSQSGDKAKAADAYEKFLLMLPTNPWLVPVISDGVMSAAVDDGKRDAALAKRLYPLLAKPFAAHRFDFARRATRILLAPQIGQAETVAALAEFEPHLPWTHEILKIRSDVYAATNHPLAAQAQRDLEFFERHRRKE